MLKFKVFTTRELLVKWANSKQGTDYIISIIYDDNKEWTIFYIID